MLRTPKVLAAILQDDYTPTLREKISDAAMDIFEAVGNLDLLRPVWIAIDASILVINIVVYTAIH